METIRLATHPHHEPGTPTALLAHEHEVIQRALTLLERLGQRLEAGEALNRDALPWLVDFFRGFADRCHHAKEEEHLFPALERHGVPTAGGPLGVMREEHEEGRALIRVIAAGDAVEVAAAIRRYVPLLRAHIDKENTVLFPLAEQILPEEEQREIVRGFEAVEQAVTGPGGHERFLTGLARLEGS